MARRIYAGGEGLLARPVAVAAGGAAIGLAGTAEGSAPAASGRWSSLRRVGRATVALACVLALGACLSQGPRGARDRPVVTTVPSPPPPAEPAVGARPVTDGIARVGLLLPLTGGPPGGIGQMMSQAAELAAVDFGTAEFVLLPRDTGGTPEGAAAAARSVLAEGAHLILGPFYGRNVPSVAEVAESEAVNVIAFTTDATVAGGNALAMGFLPGNEVDRVFQYALSQGIRTFGVIAPDSSYGRVVGEAAEAVASTRGAQLVSVRYYPAETTDYIGFVDSALGGGVPQAVLMPDAGLRLSALASMLPQYGGAASQILGTGIWTGQPIGAEPTLVGSWYAAPEPALRSSFEQAYAQYYGGRPVPMATLAYDAVALSATLARQPGFRAYSHELLTDPSGFSGVGGIFRFDRASGLVERGLAILEVTADGAVMRQAAPLSFVGAGL